jgi:hypothetical protein
VIELIELGGYIGVNLQKVRGGALQNVAWGIDHYFLVHPILQLIHGWLFSTSHQTSSFADFSATASLSLAREEVRTSKVSGSVVAGTIRLAVAT